MAPPRSHPLPSPSYISLSATIVFTFLTHPKSSATIIITIISTYIHILVPLTQPYNQQSTEIEKWLSPSDPRENFILSTYSSLNHHRPFGCCVWHSGAAICYRIVLIIFFNVFLWLFRNPISVIALRMIISTLRMIISTLWMVISTEIYIRY